MSNRVLLYIIALMLISLAWQPTQAESSNLVDVVFYASPPQGTLYFEMMRVDRDPNLLATQPYQPHLFVMDMASGQLAHSQAIPVSAAHFQRVDADTLAYYTFTPLAYLLQIFGYRYGGLPGVDGGYYQLLDNAYQPIGRIARHRGIDRHVLQRLDNGNWLYLESVYRWAAQGEPCAMVTQKLIEANHTGDPAFTFDLTPHYMDDTSSCPATGGRMMRRGLRNATIVDVTHANHVSVDADGNYLISVRAFDEVLQVNRTTGAVMWRLGGVRSQANDFTFINDPLNGFSAQHTPTWLANGNLLVFDNGNFHDEQITRVVEYALDIENKTATLVWSYQREDAAFAPFRGSAVRLPNGDTLINWVLNRPNITLVSPAGQTKMAITLPERYSSYQANYVP